MSLPRAALHDHHVIRLAAWCVPPYRVGVFRRRRARDESAGCVAGCKRVLGVVAELCGGETHDRVWVRRSTRLRHYCVCVVWGEIYFSCALYSHVSSYSHSLLSLTSAAKAVRTCRHQPYTTILVSGKHAKIHHLSPAPALARTTHDHTPLGAGRHGWNLRRMSPHDVQSAGQSQAELAQCVVEGHALLEALVVDLAE